MLSINLTQCTLVDEIFQANHDSRICLESVGSVRLTRCLIDTFLTIISRDTVIIINCQFKRSKHDYFEHGSYGNITATVILAVDNNVITAHKLFDVSCRVVLCAWAIPPPLNYILSVRTPEITAAMSMIDTIPFNASHSTYSSTIGQWVDRQKIDLPVIPGYDWSKVTCRPCIVCTVRDSPKVLTHHAVVESGWD